MVSLVCHLQRFQKLLQPTWFHRTSMPLTASGRAPFPMPPIPSPALQFLWQFLALVNARKFEHLLKDLLFWKQVKEHFFLKQLTLMNPKYAIYGASWSRKRKNLMCTCLYTSGALADDSCSQHSRFYLTSKNPASITESSVSSALTCTHIFHKLFLCMTAKVKKEERKCYLHL